jgi:hypothetical protein
MSDGPTSTPILGGPGILTSNLRTSSAIEGAGTRDPLQATNQGQGAAGRTGTPILGGPKIPTSNLHTSGAAEGAGTRDVLQAANQGERATAQEILATCDKLVMDYRNLRISKAGALLQIYSALTLAIPEGGEDVE